MQIQGNTVKILAIYDKDEENPPHHYDAALRILRYTITQHI